jgi:hypothetical protein
MGTSSRFLTMKFDWMVPERGFACPEDGRTKGASTQFQWQACRTFGARKRTRTSTPLRELAPEASASANSAIRACKRVLRGKLIVPVGCCVCQRGRRHDIEDVKMCPSVPGAFNENGFRRRSGLPERRRHERKERVYIAKQTADVRHEPGARGRARGKFPAYHPTLEFFPFRWCERPARVFGPFAFFG